MKQLPLFLTTVLLTACGGEQTAGETSEREETHSPPFECYGNAQGTTYAVLVNDPIECTRDTIEQVLRQFDEALSGYLAQSIVSRLNDAPRGKFDYRDAKGYFNRCYQLSQRLYALTAGAFDPTVYPLTAEWGFLKGDFAVPDTHTVDALRRLLGFENGRHFSFLTTVKQGDTLPNNRIVKKTAQAKLDFNAIAQGLAVDVLSELLTAKGARNYFVEIGGEIRVSGTNAEGQAWRIGVDQPIERSTATNRALQTIVQLNNKSIATSGSYRKFYRKNGVKYAHTIDPLTGYPVAHRLLSATVVANDCGTADALATAFMVMGTEKTAAFVEEHPALDIAVYLIFTNEKGRLETYYTKSFQQLMVD